MIVKNVVINIRLGNVLLSINNASNVKLKVILKFVVNMLKVMIILILIITLIHMKMLIYFFNWQCNKLISDTNHKWVKTFLANNKQINFKLASGVDLNVLSDSM